MELKKEGHFSSYIWKRKKNRTMDMHKVLANPPLINEIYVLFGLCTTGENRDKLIRKLNNVSKKRKRTAAIQEQVQSPSNINADITHCVKQKSHKQCKNSSFNTSQCKLSLASLTKLAEKRHFL
jgi:hypothetical protein